MRGVAVIILLIIVLLVGFQAKGKIAQVTICIISYTRTPSIRVATCICTFNYIHNIG